MNPKAAVRILSVVLTIVAVQMMAHAQDPADADPQHYRVVYEDDRIRVLRVTLKPGDAAVRHSHPAGSSVIHLTDNRATFTLPYSNFGDRESKAGMINKLDAGTHAPENNSDAIFEAMIVEVRRDAPVNADAKPGQEETVCANDRVPPGWAVIDTGGTDFVKCGSDFRNTKVIRKVQGLPLGAELKICRDAAIPDGFEETGLSTDFTRCKGKTTSFDNVRQIKRIN